MDRGRERSPPRRARSHSPPRDDDRRRPYGGDDRGARRYDSRDDGGDRRRYDDGGAQRRSDYDDRRRYDEDRRHDEDDRRDAGGSSSSSSSSRRFDGDRDRGGDRGRGYDDDAGRRPRSRSRDRDQPPPRRDGDEGGGRAPSKPVPAPSAGPVIPEHVRAAIAALKEGRASATAATSSAAPPTASPPRSPLAPPPPLPVPAAATAAPPAAAAPPPAQPTLLPAPNTQADFGLSGALAGDTATGATVNGVTLKWSEPPDAARPPRDGPKWQLHAFKGADALEPLPIYRQSAYLVGRDRRVADIPSDHPSCSSQHAVLQFRGVVERPRDEDGEVNPFAPAAKVVKPYVLDLESTNGTWLNGSRLPPARYVELRPKDVLRFGSSSREYVLMHDRMV
jgi:smad nuclear-interacting protein 1